MSETLTLFGAEYTQETIDGLWKIGTQFFADGFVMAELFDKNIFSELKDAKEIQIQDLISCRFFEAGRQIKCRRVRDDAFWTVSDFPLNGFDSIGETSCCEIIPSEIFLWGHYNSQIGYLYEERIPVLFPSPKGLVDGDRLAVSVLEYRDLYGNTVWDRFTGIVKRGKADD